MLYFHFETTKFELQESAISKWFIHVAEVHNKAIGEINYIFCDDEYLLKMNIKYLNHNTLTDVISFDNSFGNQLFGDIFISTERVKENAQIYKVSFLNELYRVMAHGLLHFIGFKDKTDEEKQQMRLAENEALQILTEKFHVEH